MACLPGLCLIMKGRKSLSEDQVKRLQKGQFTCRCRECVKDQVWGFSLATPSRCSIFFPITVWKNVTKIRQWRRSRVLIVTFEHISHLFVMFLLLTLNKKIIAGYSSKSSALNLDLNYWYFHFDKYLPIKIKFTYQ